MRTAAWRYTEWAAFPCGHFLDAPMNGTAAADPRGDLVYGRELYSHAGDPSSSFGGFENENLAYLPANAATVRAGAPQTRGLRVFLTPPEHRFTSFHTFLIVEFGGHIPTSPSFCSP
jgi:hypothetical protein